MMAREGKVGTRCMPGCVIACRNLYVDESGKPIVGTVQYETIALVGSNLGLDNLDDVATINYMCNDFGLDTIETGAALGVALRLAWPIRRFDGIVVVKQVERNRLIRSRMRSSKRAACSASPSGLRQAMPG
jgi:aldehyde:ferredoxin oxidoreductase